MRPIILLATVVALASGLLGAFAYGELFGRAQAVPSAQAVREHNLDGGGLIRVHEQGTASVNVTNPSLPVSGTVDVGNLPVVQDVNVLSLPSTSGRLIELGTQTVPGGGSFHTPFADVSDCQRVTLMAKSSSGFPTGASIEYMSPDGTTRITAPNIGGAQGSGGGTYSSHNIEIVMPFISLQASNGNLGTPTDLTAWIWCAP